MINVRGSKTNTESGHYYHSHLHFILLLPSEDLKKKLALLDKVKSWWFRYIEKHGGVVYDVRNKLLNESVAFRVEKDVNQDKAVSRYITKHLKSMELVYAQTKESKNLSLEQLKSRISLGMGNTDAYVYLLRSYYKCVYGRSRFKKTKQIIDAYVEAWRDRLDWLRTREAYRQIISMRRNSVLQSLGREQEVLIVSHIKHAVLAAKEDWVRGPTLFNRYGYNKAVMVQEEENELIFEEALESANIHYEGAFITLAEEVRVREKELYDNGRFSYVERFSGGEKDVVLETIRIPNVVYKWLVSENILIPILYRLRNKIKFGYDVPFYNLIKAVFAKVSSRMGEPQIVLTEYTKKVREEGHWRAFGLRTTVEKIEELKKEGKIRPCDISWQDPVEREEIHHKREIVKKYEYPLFTVHDGEAIYKALLMGSCKEFQAGTVHYDGGAW